MLRKTTRVRSSAAAIHPQLAQQLNLAEGPVSFLIILDDQVDVAGESAQSGLISVAATKLGQGTPWLGVARFSGDPCAQSAVGVDDIGDFVDVLMEDLSAIDSLEVTVGYTEVGENPALYWCEPMASGAGSLAARSIGSTRPSS